MKYFVLIPDGMADERIAALDDLTPMEKADKPCTDTLRRTLLSFWSPEVISPAVWQGLCKSSLQSTVSPT